MNENNGDNRMGEKLMNTSDRIEKIDVVVCRGKLIKPID
tara:strand:- start:831 stop:947 length:117 start_codon:yes stop_codon:yes gene_type:complete